MVALALGLYFVPEAEARFALDRARTAHGELWRLWTCHLVHFGGSHLIWDSVVVALAGAYAERVARTRVRVLYAIAPPTIALTLLAASREMTTYAGLSGVGVALIAFLAIDRWRAVALAQRWIWAAILGLLLLKLALDSSGILGSPVRFSDAGVRPVPLAHVIGFDCGVILGVVRRRASLHGLRRL